MADRPGGSLPALPRPRPARPRSGLSYSFHRRVHHTTSDAQLLVFLALAVTLAALLVLAGVTLAVGSVALVVVSPILLIASPLWAPLALVAIVAGAALLFGWGLAVFVLGAGTWAHRHFTGRHPVCANRVGYAYDDARGRGLFASAGSPGTNYYYRRGYGRRKDAA